MNQPSLTNSERMLLARRRSGTTQRAAARKRGVSLHTYRAWEGGATSCPATSLPDLREHEYYFVLRRRCSMSVQQLADELDVTRWWLIRMEKGKAPVKRLRQYWQGRTSTGGHPA